MRTGELHRKVSYMHIRTYQFVHEMTLSLSLSLPLSLSLSLVAYPTYDMCASYLCIIHVPMYIYKVTYSLFLLQVMSVSICLHLYVCLYVYIHIHTCIHTYIMYDAYIRTQAASDRNSQERLTGKYPRGKLPMDVVSLHVCACMHTCMSMYGARIHVWASVCLYVPIIVIDCCFAIDVRSKAM